MYKRIITLGIFVSIVFFVFAAYEPQANSVAAAGTTVGTIAYVKPGNSDEIWLIEPNGSNNRRIYTNNIPDPYLVHGISALAT